MYNNKTTTWNSILMLILTLDVISVSEPSDKQKIILEKGKTWKGHSTLLIQKANLVCSKCNWMQIWVQALDCEQMWFFLFVFKVPGTLVENISFNPLFSATRYSSKILYQNMIFCFKLHLNLWLIKLQL